MKTLYIIHGWTYTIVPWERTIDILKKDYGIKVEMLHVPGLTATSYKVWTIDEYVEWANKNLPKGCIALGHSNGGRILLNLSVKYPEKLGHLILLNSAGVYEESKKRAAARKASKVFSPLKKIKPLRKVVHKLLGASDYDQAPENMKKTLANMLDSDKKLNLKKVTTPTIMLWGEADTTTPLRQGEAMHEKIAGSTLKTYKNWTHAPYISDPAALASAISVAYKEAETAIENAKNATPEAEFDSKNAKDAVTGAKSASNSAKSSEKAAGKGTA